MEERLCSSGVLPEKSDLADFYGQSAGLSSGTGVLFGYKCSGHSPDSLFPNSNTPMQSTVYLRPPRFLAFRSAMLSAWRMGRLVLLAVLGLVPTSTEAQCQRGAPLEFSVLLPWADVSEKGFLGAPVLDGFGQEARAPLRASVTWPYARGRAVLSTAVPLAVGGALLQLSPAGPTSVPLGLGVGGVGLLVGPSMGQWCLGGEYATESILHTSARVAGMGGLVWAVKSGRQQIEEAPFALLPEAVAFTGIVVVVAGGVLLRTVLWTIGETPRLACDPDRRNSAVSLSPIVDPQTRGGGVHLSLRF